MSANPTTPSFRSCSRDRRGCGDLDVGCLRGPNVIDPAGQGPPSPSPQGIADIDAVAPGKKHDNPPSGPLEGVAHILYAASHEFIGAAVDDQGVHAFFGHGLSQHAVTPSRSAGEEMCVLRFLLPYSFSSFVAGASVLTPAVWRRMFTIDGSSSSSHISSVVREAMNPPSVILTRAFS